MVASCTAVCFAQDRLDNQTAFRVNVNLSVLSYCNKRAIRLMSFVKGFATASKHLTDVI